jgi:tetratricopeptide (TPR) repeat protein
VARPAIVTEEAVKMDPRFATAYQNLGRSYEQKGMYAEAVATFQELNKVAPDNGLAFLGRADALAGFSLRGFSLKGKCLKAYF